MNKYLVTGAAGFIGSKTSELLLKAGNLVVGLDNLNDYYDVDLKKHRLENLKKHENFKFELADIENIDVLRKIFENNKFTAVINLAARAGVRASIENPFVYAMTNIVGTMNLLELCRQFGTSKFVLASSSSLYAGETTPFSEDMTVTKPISQYAATKLSAEVLAYSYHHLYNVDTSVLRFFTVYGPAGRPDMSYFKFIESIKNGLPITIYGDGSQRRDFTYIDDIARGVVLSLMPLGYEIINLGGGKKPISINEMINLIEIRLDKKAIIHYKEFDKADMLETGADISKAARLLGWSPEIDFIDGINQTVDWFFQQKAKLSGTNL